MTLPTPERVRELADAYRARSQQTRRTPDDRAEFADTAAILADWLRLATPVGEPLEILSGRYLMPDGSVQVKPHRREPSGSIVPTPSAQAKCETCGGAASIRKEWGGGSFSTDRCTACNGTGTAPPSAQASDDAALIANLRGMLQLANERAELNARQREEYRLANEHNLETLHSWKMNAAPSAQAREALEQINVAACYATEEDPGAAAEALLHIGDMARTALRSLSVGGVEGASNEVRKALADATDRVRYLLQFVTAPEIREECARWDALLAPSATSAVDSQWRDIATAPRDGRTVLLNRSGSASVYTGEYVTAGETGWWRDTHGWQRDPTKWQPLPAAPVSA